MSQPNALEEFIADNFMFECSVMDRLQDAGIISDNCIDASSVATIDQAIAIDYLKQNTP